MIALALLALFPIAFCAFGIYLAIDNWRNGRDVGSER